MHRLLNIAPCDFIIHSGDIFRRSNPETILEFIDWFSALPAKYKILIAGNHDRFIAREKETFLKFIEAKLFILKIRGLKLKGSSFGDLRQ
jgi:DNA repair exonuclease SbcCD nuclease subunit